LGNAGYGTLIWVVTAEILPPKVRSIANSIIICFAFLCGFIIAKTFVDLLEGLQRSGVNVLKLLVSVIGATTSKAKVCVTGKSFQANLKIVVSPGVSLEVATEICGNTPIIFTGVLR
jgi:hypothetical protein